ncbi:Mitochondrial intermembrane space import and assembly protein 40 [Lamellibrachia satsuma]|nr:Mitochondrial intermembrane space import and assembly protein 40 [Lamellibrachia satsuma]
MSYCVNEGGKDTVVFVDKDDHQKPAEVKFEMPEEEAPGLIYPNGDINWACPCLGGMATGPCGFDFREAFSCFHYSTEDPKGSDCYEQFRKMQQCMSAYPDLYGDDDDKKDDNGDNLDDAFDQLDAETKDNKDGESFRNC